MDKDQGNLQDKEAHEMVITRMIKPKESFLSINIVYKCPGDMLVSN
jgi:hypothetical protein